MLISKISHLLFGNEEYYTLRIIYQTFVLPILIAKFKTHKKIGDEIYKIAEFFVAGFMIHCDIGLEGL